MFSGLMILLLSACGYKKQQLQHVVKKDKYVRVLSNNCEDLVSFGVIQQAKRLCFWDVQFEDGNNTSRECPWRCEQP